MLKQVRRIDIRASRISSEADRRVSQAEVTQLANKLMKRSRCQPVGTRSVLLPFLQRPNRYLQLQRRLALGVIMPFQPRIQAVLQGLRAGLPALTMFRATTTS